MKNLILILITAFALVGCKSNPLQGTQWEGIGGTMGEVSLISFDNDKCTFYMKSSLNGKTTSVELKYEVSDNIITFSAIDVHMEKYPVLKLDGDFLIFETTNAPSFKKVSK